MLRKLNMTKIASLSMIQTGIFRFSTKPRNDKNVVIASEFDKIRVAIYDSCHFERSEKSL
ncbi:hypothetical protein [Helicobacter sp. T3_23-1059]